MKLEDLISRLQSEQEIEQLLKNDAANILLEDLLVYMINRLELESELRFFDINETSDKLYFEQKGVNYIQLFPFDYIVDLTTSILDVKGKSIHEIAERLLEYRIRDA